MPSLNRLRRRGRKTAKAVFLPGMISVAVLLLGNQLGEEGGGGGGEDADTDEVAGTMAGGGEDGNFVLGGSAEELVGVAF